MNAAVWWRGVADGSRSGFVVCCLKILLMPPALLYGFALRIRSVLYELGLQATRRLPCPVISIGNITVGGTGKTPATVLVARELQRRGCRVAVISRGYGGSLEGQVAVVSNGSVVALRPEQCGDEPCLLARMLPGVAVLIGSDRYRAGLYALEQLQPDLVVLDDGFQHIRLHRDLNILLLDGARPFGNGWTLPLGLLREPCSAVKRADLVLFTRCKNGQSVPDTGLPSCCSEHRLTGFNLLDSGEEMRLETLRQGRIAAFAGIAEPDSFFEGLRQLGISLIAVLTLPDHEPYHASGLERLDAFVTAHQPDWLLTTAKDGVKLADCRAAWGHRLVTVRLELALFDDGQALKAALDKLLSSRP